MAHGAPKSETVLDSGVLDYGVDYGVDYGILEVDCEVDYGVDSGWMGGGIMGWILGWILGWTLRWILGWIRRPVSAREASFCTGGREPAENRRRTGGSGFGYRAPVCQSGASFDTLLEPFSLL